MKSFLITHKVEILFVLLIAFSLLFAFSEFLERPAFWFDEGITIEIARNLALFGTPDILTSPDTFSGFAYLVGTNGYPLTVPLALFFKIFGIGLFQARIFMIFWLVAFMVSVYFIGRKLFSALSAISAIALIVSFASLYGNGLTATGELPGLLFFVWGIYFLLEKKSYFWTGIFWGLAMTAKPGVFLLLAHTLVIYLILADRSDWLKKILKAGLGFLIPIFIWVILAFPLNMTTLYSSIEYALNPIEIPVVRSLLENLPRETLNEGLIVRNTEPVEENVRRNIKLFATHSTLIYFSMLLILCSIGLLLRDYKDKKGKQMFFLVISYTFLTLFFFLRGPGWIRYLIGFQILLFISLPPALEGILSKVGQNFPNDRKKIFTMIAISTLFVLQIFQLYFFSNIPDSKSILESLNYVSDRMEENQEITLGLYNTPEIAAFSDPKRTFHISLPQHDQPPLGESPLMMDKLPDIVIVNKKNLLIGDNERRVLDMGYRQINDIKKFNVYEKRL